MGLRFGNTYYQTFIPIWQGCALPDWARKCDRLYLGTDKLHGNDDDIVITGGKPGVVMVELIGQIRARPCSKIKNFPSEKKGKLGCP